MTKQIFCNRSLNMKSIKAVGFDMDYTLVQYKAETFEALAHEQTIIKLVNLGYPPALFDLKFEWRYMMRGLVIDKVGAECRAVSISRRGDYAMHLRFVKGVERFRVCRPSRPGSTPYTKHVSAITAIFPPITFVRLHSWREHQYTNEQASSPACLVSQPLA